MPMNNQELSNIVKERLEADSEIGEHRWVSIQHCNVTHVVRVGQEASSPKFR